MKRITTVRGDIFPEELGFTTMHEHTICDLAFLRNQLGFIPPIPSEKLTLTPENMASLRSGLGLFSDECSTLGDVDYLTKELTAFKKIGGNAVVDASPIGLRGDVTDMKEASEMADVHIVCATGLYHAAAQPEEFMSRSEKELIAHFEKEIKEGIDGTTIKPGFLKCALNVLNPDCTIHEIELKTLRACAKVAAYTGMSLHVHTAAPLTGEHILQGVDIAIYECGMKPEKVHIMHLDSFLRTPSKISDYYSTIEAVRCVNTDLQTKVLEKGVNIGFDSWGMLVNTLPDDYDRVKGLADLLKKGYASQIALGHDIYDKSRGVTYGYTGFTGFAGFVLPILKELGFGDDIINKLTVENPARILAY
ncbi:phosphotriesterase family protein [Paenibacillus sinopodophylli]|uniref:phosphotriesterase family protein n=1 Tax=Paenibacillus sinopodophylli TaxID=1837342 RepID=UPI00110C919C|nr:phosphotriesterase [Paenibacillus sinopodophylli]